MAVVGAFAFAGGDGEAAKTDEGESKGLIGISMRYIGGDFSLAIIKNAKEAFEKAGYSVTVVDAQTDPNVQLQQIETLISSGAVGIIAGAQDPEAVVQAVKMLNDANIPSCWFDTPPAGGKIDLFVSFDNVSAGRKAGEAMEKALKEKGMLSGVVLEIGGDLRHVDAAGGRSDGFQEVMGKYPNIEIVKQPSDWDPDIAFNNVTDLLTKYGDKVIGITSASDVMLPGILSAMDNAGILLVKSNSDHVVLTSIDGFSVGLDAVDDGYLDGIALQPANSYGLLTAEHLIKLLSGEKVVFTEGQVIEEEGAPWTPATMTLNEIGPFMSLSSVTVPDDIDTKSMLLWANQMASEN